MKLLFVTPYFYPKLGGLENYVYSFALELQKKHNVSIVVITSNHMEKRNTKEFINGIKIYRLAPLLKISNTPINPLWIWEIKRILKEENPDVINAHTPVPGIADITAFTANRTPFILTYHALTLYKYNFTFFNALVKFYKLLEHSTFSKANKIIVVSDEVKKHIHKRFYPKISVIYNALSKPEITRTKRNLHNKPQVIFIGSLDKSHEWKGLGEILDAIKILTGKGVKIHLAVIGDGNNKCHYEKMVKENHLDNHITFYGRQEGESKARILSSSSLAIIYPKSSNDAFPTVALEYWSYKLPIIAANILPINALFKHQVTAYLAKPKRPDLLAKAIETIFSNPQLSQIIANNGYKELTQKYSLENEVKKFYQLLKEATQ